MAHPGCLWPTAAGGAAPPGAARAGRRSVGDGRRAGRRGPRSGTQGCSPRSPRWRVASRAAAPSGLPSRHPAPASDRGSWGAWRSSGVGTVAGHDGLDERQLGGRPDPRGDRPEMRPSRLEAIPGRLPASHPRAAAGRSGHGRRGRRRKRRGPRTARAVARSGAAVAHRAAGGSAARRRPKRARRRSRHSSVAWQACHAAIDSGKHEQAGRYEVGLRLQELGADLETLVARPDEQAGRAAGARRSA